MLEPGILLGDLSVPSSGTAYYLPKKCFTCQSPSSATQAAVHPRGLSGEGCLETRIPVLEGGYSDSFCFVFVSLGVSVWGVLILLAGMGWASRRTTL